MNKNMIHSKKSILMVLSAFVLTALIGILILYIRKIAPFGDHSIIAIDCYHQYAPFLLEMRHRILEGKSLIYSWEAGLGRDLYVQTAYYTMSPLDYLVLLIQPKQICSFVSVLILLKMSLCGASFTWYLNRKYQRYDVASVIGGFLYAYCGFIACYYWNFMWLDILALFPVLAWSVEQMVRNRRFLLFTLVLAAMLIINFYLAVVTYIFTFFYYVKCLFEDSREQTERVACTLLFLAGTFIAGLCAAFILLPSLLAIRATGASDSQSPTLTVYMSLFQLVAAHFSGARPSVLSRNEDAPNIYSGVITLMILPAYFKVGKDSLRVKIGNFLLLLVMILCCVVEPLDYAVHGFYFTANLPHRFVFIYSFMLLTMAYQVLPAYHEFPRRDIILTALVWGGLLVLTDRVIITHIEDFEPVLSDKELIANLALLGIYALLLCLYGRSARPIWKRTITGMLLAGILVEAGYMFHNGIEITTSRSQYIANMDDTQEAMNWERENTDELFYRSEYSRLSAINEGSIYHFNGFSTFSSMVPGGTDDLMKSLGVVASGKTFRYYDPTPLIDAIFDMKYVYSRDNQGIGYSMESRKNFHSIDLWENTRYLPLGFMVNNNIENWKTEDSQPFAVQNDFIHRATDVEGDMFTMVPAANVNLDHGKFLSTEGTGGFSYKLNDPYDLEDVPVVTVTFDIDQDEYLYLYVSSDNTDSVRYMKSGVVQERDLGAGNETIDVGQVQKGDTVVVQFALDKRGEFETHYKEMGAVEIYAAAYNDKVFDMAFREMRKEPLELTSFSDTDFTGTVTTASDGILFTSIPWSKGWSVDVDGKKTQTTPIGEDGLIGVKIPEGTHSVHFRYHTQGLKAGIVLSSAGVLFYIFAAVYSARNRKRSRTGKAGFHPHTRARGGA